MGLGVVNDPIQGQAWRDRAKAKPKPTAVKPAAGSGAK